jgi:hypothetical protein
VLGHYRAHAQPAPDHPVSPDMMGNGQTSTSVLRAD